MSRLDGPAGRGFVQAGADRHAELLAEERRDRVADLAEGGGRGPANRYRSGNVWSRAASRTVRVRLSFGWMYQ